MHVHSHGVIGSCVSNLEMPTEATVDRYLQTTTAHYRAPPDHLDSQTPTPTAPDSYDRYTHSMSILLFMCIYVVIALTYNPIW